MCMPVPEKSVAFPGAGLTGSSDPPDKVNCNLGSLEDSDVLSTAESLLQPIYYFSGDTLLSPG